MKRLAAALLLLATAIPSRGEDDPAIVAALAPIRERHNLPALAGAVVTGDGKVTMGVVGVRKSGTNVAATVDDLWHLGSNSKAMTATAVARLVEQGKLRWATTLAELFPDLAPAMRPEYRAATVRQLLSHRAGLTANLDWHAIAKSGSVQEQRRRCVQLATTAEPPFAVGGTNHYSNLGYVIAGAVIEQVTGHRWEDAMRELVFAPLQMTSAGFGGTGTRGQVDQPWPHRAEAQPTESNGPDVDNPPVIGPAGRVHCTLADWAKFIADQLRGARGEQPSLLRPESYAALHTATDGGDYALGWGTAQREWGGGPVLTHAGCNTMNYSVAWLAPRKNFAVLICTNQGDADAAKAADEAAAALIGLP